MEDGGIEGASDVRTVVGRARVFWKGCEADLIVDDQMDGTAVGIALADSELQSFIDHTLS